MLFRSLPKLQKIHFLPPEVTTIKYSSDKRGRQHGILHRPTHKEAVELLSRHL